MFDKTERTSVIKEMSTGGVSFPCTDTVFIEKTVTIGKGTTILPNTIITGNTHIGENCVIGPNSYICDTIVGNSTSLNSTHCYSSQIGCGVTAGPFVHIRPGCKIANNVHIGNFVEIKNSTIDEGSKLPHLLYVGDADIGKNVNFGCGCVTVNYNGKSKLRTIVEDGAFIGCNTNLVAPVTIGENAFTAAGSTITESVPANALAIARSKQAIKENWVNIKKPYKRQYGD